MFATDVRERAQSCLLAGALGDAWGGPFEGKVALALVSFPAAARISDDTMLTLATCEALTLDRGRAVPERIAARFVDWFRSGRIEGLGSGTLKALRDLSAGAHWALAGVRGEYAAGSGAAMRAAPLAFVLDPNLDADRRTIRDIARITHHSDEAYTAALAVSAAVRLCVESSTVPEDLLSSILDVLPDTSERERIEELSASSLSVAEAARIHGASGYAVEAIPLALLVAVRTAGQPLSATITTAISVGGDTDTIASIAAQVVGASGQKAPEELLNQIAGIQDVRKIVDEFTRISL